MHQNPQKSGLFLQTRCNLWKTSVNLWKTFLVAVENLPPAVEILGKV